MKLKQLPWYYQRLRSMSASEVAWRFRRLHRQVRARLLRQWIESGQESRLGRMRAAGAARSGCRFYGLAGIRPGDVRADWRQRVIADADRTLAHRFQCLALEEVQLPPVVNWNHEQKRGIDTPLLFGPWMDYSDSPRFGDFKYFWELPRLQHLLAPAKAFFLTGEERYAAEVMSQLRSFQDQSPYLLGVNWIMPLESGIRLISLSWIAELLRDYLTEHGDAGRLLDLQVLQNVEHVAGSYSAYSSANNHLVGEASGVFIASIRFGHLAGVARHREEAYRILCREIALQHHADGVNGEQALNYQVFSFYFFLLAALLGRQNGIDFPEEYWRVLEKSAAFIAALSGPDGGLPGIGDSDDGRAVVLSEDSEVQAALAAAAVIWKRGDFRARCGGLNESAFWLLGPQAERDFAQVLPDERRNSTAFESGGYFVLWDPARRARLVFDCGPLGYGAIAAHGHADCLSVILEVDGKWFLVDPGTYTYCKNDPFRNYFRSTAAHNTVRIDGVEQSGMGGPFLWKRKAAARLESWRAGAERDEVIGSHDGYAALEDPVVHRRRITLEKREGLIHIEDHIECAGAHRVEQFFHFAPGCRVSRESDRTWRAARDGKSILLRVAPEAAARTVAGSSAPLLGWYSERYDRKAPATTLVCEAQVKGGQILRTEIDLKA